MKKTLIAVAALSAMAASAMAANVTVSGVVDLGLNFQNVKKSEFTDASKNGTSRTFTLNNGQNSGSRVMFKGSEDLGNGVEVGFQLESGFKADNGTLGGRNNIFQRESRLYVKTAFIFGGGDLCAFGTVLGDTIMKESKIFEGLTARFDNTVAYQSPTFAGATLYVAHSFKTSDQLDAKDEGWKAEDEGGEGRPSANQYNGVGLKYANGPFNAAFVASQKRYASATNKKDSKEFSLGAAYDFGVCKLMAETQYFNMGRTDKALNKGWGGIISVTAPVAGGKILASVGYKDAKNIDDTDKKNKVWNAGLEYTYSLSKRTTFYVGAGYTEDKNEDNGVTTGKTKTTEVVTGLVHKF